MKRLARCALVAAALIPAAVWAQGIRNSRHDLSESSSNTTEATTVNQICVFCHTPHRAASTQLLWNRNSSTATVQWGNDLDTGSVTATREGTSLPVSLRSGSRRCLSCHDGSIAIGDVLNYNAAPSGDPGIGMDGDVTAGKLTNATYLIGQSGNMQGNHPISIPYAGQTYNGIASSAAIGAAGSGDYYAVDTSSCTSPTRICTTPTGDGANGPEINLQRQAANSYGVECSTCHEPHNKSGFAYFTRVDVNNASGLCRSCHAK
ncbi:MAG: hypothetical protein HYZ28_12620 [Myxococcales bacterium]|nr:hypothetical protein [Myxococcales bacterium]